MASSCAASCTMTTGTSAGTPPDGQAGATNLPSGPATSDRGACRIPGRGGFCSRRTSCTSRTWRSSVPVMRCAAQATHSSERCGGWPAPVLQRRSVPLVATTSGAVAAFSALPRRFHRRDQPSRPTAEVSHTRSPGKSNTV